MDLDDWLPPPLPAKIGPPQHMRSFLDEVQIGLCRLYDGEDARAEEFRQLISTFDHTDSVHGNRALDLAFAAWHIKNVADDDGDLPLVAAAKVIEIRRRIQWALRRQDTPQVAFSYARRWEALEAAKAAPPITAAPQPTVTVAAPPPPAPEDNDNTEDTEV